MFGTFCCQPSSPIGTIEQVDFSMNSLKELSGLNSKLNMSYLGRGGGGSILPDVNWRDGSIRRNPKYANDITEKMLAIMGEFNLAQEVQ